MGGSIQSFATRCWHLKHLVQDSPDNCAHEQQFGTNLLRWMASLIIMLSRCSSNSLPKHTMATTRLARLYCKATGTSARSAPSTWVSCLADSYYLASGWFEPQRQLGRSVPWIFNWVPACGAFPRRLVYFLKVEFWALFQNVLQVLPQLLDPDLACDKCSVVKLLATCNCLPQAGKEISAEGQVPNGSGHLKTGGN